MYLASKQLRLENALDVAMIKDELIVYAIGN